FENIHDLRIEIERDAKVENARDLRIEYIARQPIFWDAEAHHPAGKRTRLVDFNRMSETAQVIGGRQAGWPRAHHEPALASFARRRRETPALLDRLVAEKPLDGIDADRGIDLGAIAGRLTGVIADAAHHPRQRVILCEKTPGALVLARFRV